VNREASLPHVYGKIEEDGVFDNFRLAAGERGFEYKGPCWQDSHVYKWLESAAYELAREPGAELRAKADGVIERVASAQADDGYLNTYHQVVKPGERWAHIGLNHELYSAGHLIEAAVAFSRLLGDERLLRVARRYADHIGSVLARTDAVQRRGIRRSSWRSSSCTARQGRKPPSIWRSSSLMSAAMVRPANR